MKFENAAKEIISEETVRFAGDRLVDCWGTGGKTDAAAGGRFKFFRGLPTLRFGGREA